MVGLPTMSSDLEKLTFASGTFLCLHVADVNRVPMIETALLERFRRLNLNGIIARQASRDTVRRRWFHKPSVVDWLIQNGQVSHEEAESIISGFPIRVTPLLCQNPLNPLRFLGLAAAIARNPDVITYETSGMDPRGRSMIHAYAQTHFPGGGLIHLAPFPTLRVPGCPEQGECCLIESIISSVKN